MFCHLKTTSNTSSTKKKNAMQIVVTWYHLGNIEKNVYIFTIDTSIFWDVIVQGLKLRVHTWHSEASLHRSTK